MKLYGNSLSPFVRKVLIFAAEKGVALISRPVVMGQPDPEFQRISPFGKMPGFSDGDFTISDSTAIITYLEAKHPEPALIPADPSKRARAIWYEEFIDTILVPASGPVFFNRVAAKRLGKVADLAAADKAAADDLPPLYAYLEGVVPEGEEWLAGDQLSIADIAVGSAFVSMMHCRESPEAATYPKLSAYLARWAERPSLKALVEQEKALLAR